ncbi:MAG: SRPBCC family protein [Planctomycetota bacterium]
MTSTREQTAGRVIETRLEIDAPVAAVWRALTDAEALTNWFPLDARVKPGVGGSMWMSWGEGMQWENRIDAWDEQRHLRLIWMDATPPEQAEEAKKSGAYIPFPVAVDYHLEGSGGRTVLRLVHSGFASGGAWDAQYDATRRGWSFELRGLRHYLEHHPDARRLVVQANRPLPQPLDFDAAWARIVGEDGLCREGDVRGLDEGDRYAIVTADGDRLSGAVHINRPPEDFCATVETMNDALLRLRLDHGCMTAPEPQVNLMLSTFGLEPGRANELSDRWTEMLQRLFPDDGPA